MQTAVEFNRGKDGSLFRGRHFRPAILAGMVLLSLFSGISDVRAQRDEDEFTAISVRYQTREPLGPKGFERDETADLYIEYGLLPLLSVKIGLEFSRLDFQPLPGPSSPGELEEFVLSASIRYYKAKGRFRAFGSLGIGIFIEEREQAMMERVRDADIGFLLGTGLEWTIGRHFGLELEAVLESSAGDDPDSVFVVAFGPKFFF